MPCHATPCHVMPCHAALMPLGTGWRTLSQWIDLFDLVSYDRVELSTMIDCPPPPPPPWGGGGGESARPGLGRGACGPSRMH